MAQGLFPAKNLNKQGIEGLLNPSTSSLKESTQGKEIKIPSSKQMFQILLKALEHIKSGNTSEDLLNEIRQTAYSSNRAKEI